MGRLDFNGDTRINGQFRLNGSSGVAGQVFTSSGGTNVPSWTTLGTMSTQNANSVNISGTVQTANFNATGEFKMNGSTGSAGQVLVSLVQMHTYLDNITILCFRYDNVMVRFYKFCS